MLKDTHFPEYEQPNPHNEAVYSAENNLHKCVPKHMFIRGCDRSWHNKVLKFINTIMRMLIVSIWFYFVPFIALIANFIVPQYLIDKAKNEADASAAGSGG